MLLDAQVYEDLEGRWVDLFNRMKWDIIKSVLKSVAGLQGRKFKVHNSPCIAQSQACQLSSQPGNKHRALPNCKIIGFLFYFVVCQALLIHGITTMQLQKLSRSQAMQHQGTQKQN